MATSGQNTSHKNILILGGSYGGVSVAHYLLKHAIPKLPEKGSYQIVIVSPSTQAMCRPACPRAMISDDKLPQDKLFVNISEQFKQYPPTNFRFVHGTAMAVDHKDRNVTIALHDGTTSKLDFYALVIATGASTLSPLLSLNRDEIFLYDNWNKFREALPSAKNIVIAGGGPAGCECAGELAQHLNGSPGWFSSKPAHPTAKITIVTSGTQILPLLRPSLATRAESYLSHLGVSIIKSTRVTTVSPTDAGTASTNTSLTAPTTINLSNGSTLEADLYIPATGTTPNTSFLDSSLLTFDGRVSTDAATLRLSSPDTERVYAVGDCASYARPAVHLILEAVPVVCANIKRDLFAAADTTTDVAEKKFKEDTRETQMVPIGTYKGVGSAMGWALPSWMVWAIKGRDYWLWTVGNLWSGKQWNKES